MIPLHASSPPLSSCTQTLVLSFFAFLSSGFGVTSQSKFVLEQHIQEKSTFKDTEHQKRQKVSPGTFSIFFGAHLYLFGPHVANSYLIGPFVIC